MKQNPSRHHPALVSLHWLLALLIMLAMGMGTFVLKEIPNTSPEKLGALQGHMIMGFAIGALMMARLIVRLRTSHPQVASTGSNALNLLGKRCACGPVPAGLRHGRQRCRYSTASGIAADDFCG
jgi:cytochrome b561